MLLLDPRASALQILLLVENIDKTIAELRQIHTEH
jgi:hypothetical protein